jgi:flagellar hook-basal body complex protein FliE
MDALSAIKMMAPQLTGALGGAGQAGGAGAPVSTQDLQTLNAPAATQPAAGTQSSGSFSNVLSDMVGDVNAQQNAASDAVNGLLSGKNVSLHQAMISMEEASVSFQMMVEVRNKLLDSYQELMRMQV